MPPAGLARISTFAPLGRFLQVFDVHEYADGVPFTAAGHTITPRAVAHYVEPAYGFRVEHDSAVLAYSGDTGPTPALLSSRATPTCSSARRRCSSRRTIRTGT